MTEGEKLRRLERTLEQCGNTHTIQDIVDGVADGRFQWWSNDEGHVVSEIMEFPRYKVVNYFLVFGDLRHCLALEHDINPWAIENGCTMATATGRKGWARVLAPIGWKPQGTLYYKPLVRGT